VIQHLKRALGEKQYHKVSFGQFLVVKDIRMLKQKSQGKNN
jgi:hypothetical protein